MDHNRRSASPDRRRPKELSFYKKSSSSSSSRGPSGGNGGAGAVGSFSSRRDPLDKLDDRRRAGAVSVSASAGITGSGNAGGAGDDVPGRYGGSRGEYSRPVPAAGRSGRDDGRDRYGDRDRGGRSERYDIHPRQSYRDRGDPSAPGEYKGGEPLRRVPTRDERDQAPSSSASSAVYRGGDELRRVETRNEPAQGTRPIAAAASTAYGPMIEIIANDRLGRKVRVKCLPSDTVGDLKKLIAAQTGTIASKIQLKKWYTTYKDHITLGDYEINDGMSLEMY